MPTDGKRPRSWVNLAELRERLTRVAELICGEEGLERPHVTVRIAESPAPSGRRAVTVEIVEARHVDPHSPDVEQIRGFKWQDN